MYILSAEKNFPPVASAPVEGTQYAAANFNLSLLVPNPEKLKGKICNPPPTPWKFRRPFWFLKACNLYTRLSGHFGHIINFNFGPDQFSRLTFIGYKQTNNQSK